MATPPAGEESSGARKRESALGRSTLRLERRVSTRLNLEEGARRGKSRTREYMRSKISCSSTQKSSLSDRSKATPLNRQIKAKLAQNVSN